MIIRIYKDGIKHCYKNKQLGICHNDYGPKFITNGPAEIYKNGDQHYYLKGQFYLFYDWLKLRKQYL